MLARGHYARSDVLFRQVIFSRLPASNHKIATMSTVSQAKFVGVAAIVAVATAAIAVAVSPVASANVAGCLPLNGTQLNANSHEDTNYLGIIYDSNVTYWYQYGAINWHKTVDGGSFNLTHSNTSGTVPAAPGSTETIPGAGPGGKRGDEGPPSS